MNLDETLMLLAMQLQINPTELIQYAAEDVIGGYHWKPELSRWKQGSIWEVEGQVLYALIRALKPQHAVEIGSWVGCSATHIATALSVNGKGHVTAVDVDPQAGESFPAHLAAIRETVTSDGIAWLAGQEDESIDFMFEDSSHDTNQCASIAALCRTKLAPGGVLVMHDAAHDKAIVGGGQIINSLVGEEVRAGLTRALGDEYRVYISDPSDCGFAVWQRKAEPKAEFKGIPVKEGYSESAVTLPSTEENEIPAPPPKVKPRGRKPKVKA